MTLYAPDPPDGFLSFWEETYQEAASTSLDIERRPQSTVARDGFQIDTLEFRATGGRRLNGWLAVPEKTPAPGFVWLPPYGRWSMPPNQYGTRDGFCSLSLNYFGEPAFHEEAYKPERGYLTVGIESPETWVFRRIFQDSVVAGRVLMEMQELTGEGIGAMGMSQGGGLSIWMGAFAPFVKCVVADMPFGAARPIVFERDIHRYPLREAIDWWGGDAARKRRAMATMSYFDTVNIATHCKAPTLLTFGTKDPAVREFEVRSIYQALPGEKAIESMDWGHDWHESMVERNVDWLKRWLA